MPRFKNILAEGQVNDVDMMTRHLAATDWFMAGPGLINGIEGQILQQHPQSSVKQSKALSMLNWTGVKWTSIIPSPTAVGCRRMLVIVSCTLRFYHQSNDLAGLPFLLISEMHNKNKTAFLYKKIYDIFSVWDFFEKSQMERWQNLKTIHKAYRGL